MRTLRPLIPLVLMSLCLVAPASALRCGKQLANEGDLKAQVLLACGEPLSRDVIGYVDAQRSGERIRVPVVDAYRTICIAPPPQVKALFQDITKIEAFAKIHRPG